ncbi:DnaJ domain containing protein [Babesia divergens]|uniref:DnaJ domain containing protein n=1 Tax=Babesia divergens TaxID=32595 RepID=A0AAD9G705_BABDI|nr:DnaJ domain containing protein [Babesia divergens]
MIYKPTSGLYLSLFIDYHKLIRQWHPDKAQSMIHRNAEASDAHHEVSRDSAFNKIHLAYTVLSDPAKKRLYDKYGSDGVNLKNLVKKQMDREIVETHTIQEVIQDEEQIKKHDEILRISEEAEIERRIRLLMQKRHWDKFKENPVQVITRFTFSGVTSMFDNQVDALIRRRFFQIRDTVVNNSVEIALSRQTRLGCVFMSSIPRTSFGTCRGAIQLTSQITDTIQSTISVDCGDHLGYKSSSLYLKKMFADHFWVTSVLSVDRYLTPTMHCIVHKSLADRHVFELSGFPQWTLTYGYNYTIAEDLKVNMQAAVTRGGVGTVARVKAMSTSGSVIGAVCMFSMHGGLSLDGYLRQKFETEILAKMKVECRLRFRINSLYLIIRMVLNNTHIDFPIELYTGNVDYCVFLGTAAASTVMMVPVAFEMLRNLISPQMPALKDEPLVNSMRRTFYSKFPLFSYIGGWWDDGMKHEKYVNDFGSCCELMHKTAIWSEEALEGIVAREVRSAQQESDALFNVAKKIYEKEAANDGLVILFAVYGHPEAINRIQELINIDVFDHLKAVISSVNPDQRPIMCLGGTKDSVYGTVTVEYILKQNNQSRLQKLFNRYIIDVTNVLMSRVSSRWLLNASRLQVTDSSLIISTSSKKKLIGFADPCANIPNVQPELYVCYRHNKKLYTIRLRDDDPMLLPQQPTARS